MKMEIWVTDLELREVIFPWVPPVDSAQDMRGEYLKALKDMGVKVEKHHHEVAPSQHELGMYFGTLTDMADNVQFTNMLFRWLHIRLVKQLPLCQSQFKVIMDLGMHCHQSIWKGNTPVFMGKEYCRIIKKQHCIILVGF